MGFEAGLLLGERFRLVNRIAEGALGELWRGADRLPTNQVAIRLVTPKVGVTTAALDAFVEEMQTARAIGHRSMTKVLGAGRTTEGVPWVATELLRAESLESLLERRGTLLPGAALHLIADLAGALAEAHQHGMVHRGIEPRSVLLHLDEKGAVTAKLVDFGRARMFARSPKELRNEGNLPPYASPEAVFGTRTGPEVDVWSLGVLLFRCVTGKLPFSSTNVSGFAAQARAIAKTLNEWIEEPAVRRIAEECLRYAREQRVSMEALADSAQLAAWSTRGGFADLAKMVRIPEPFLDAQKYGEIAHYSTIPGLARQEASVPPPRKKAPPSPPRAAPPPLPVATPFLLEMPRNVPSDPPPLPVSEPPVAISVTREARTAVTSKIDFRPAWSPWRKRAAFVAGAACIAGLVGAVTRSSPPRRARAAAAAGVADAPVSHPTLAAPPRPVAEIVKPIAGAASSPAAPSATAVPKNEPKVPTETKAPAPPGKVDDNPYQ